MVRCDGITRRQIASDGVELKCRVERIDESPVEEQALIQGVFTFLIQLREMALSVQIAEQSAYLLDYRFPAQPLFQSAEIEHVDEEALVEQPLASRGLITYSMLPDNTVELPKRPAFQLAP